MGTIAEKITYLGETKTEIKDAINLMGTNITNDTFRSYPDKIKDGLLDIINNGTEQIWNNWEKVTGTGTSVSLGNVVQAPMKIDAQGNTIQEGTPSPTNPVPINSVGDNVNEINLELKESGNSNGVGTYTINSNDIELSGKSAWSNYALTFINNWKGKNITISYDELTSLTRRGGLTVYGSDNTEFQDLTSILSDTNDITADTNVHRIINISAGTSNYLVLRFWTNASATALSDTIPIMYSNIKLEQGTQATPYSPYNMGSIAIDKCNKNLLVNTASSQTKSGVDLTVNEDGTIIANGTANANIYFWLNQNLEITNGGSIALLTLSGNISGSKHINLGFYDSNTENSITNSEVGTNTSVLNPEIVYTKARIVILKDTVCNNIKLGAMLLKETTQQSKENMQYTPHQSTTYPIYTQAPMRSIGDIRDDFVKQAGVWYERHKIGRVVFTGAESENWLRNSNAENYYRLVISLDNSISVTNNDNVIRCKSDYFVGASATKTIITNPTANLIAIISNNRVMVNLIDTTLFGAETFKTWLSTHNTEVIYELAEPTLTPCTAEQVEQLEAISQAKSYNEQTNIYSNDVVVPYFDCVALKNI